MSSIGEEEDTVHTPDMNTVSSREAHTIHIHLRAASHMRMHAHEPHTHAHNTLTYASLCSALAYHLLTPRPICDSSVRLLFSLSSLRCWLGLQYAVDVRMPAHMQGVSDYTLSANKNDDLEDIYRRWRRTAHAHTRTHTHAHAQTHTLKHNFGSESLFCCCYYHFEYCYFHFTTTSTSTTTNFATLAGTR